MGDAREVLYELIGGFRVAQMVRAAAALGVCDELTGGPLAHADLAARVGADPSLLRRLLRGLCAYGVIKEEADGRFVNTELGELLRRDVPGSLRNTAIGLTEPAWWEAWSQLPAGVRTGGVPFRLAHQGRSFWELVEAEPEVKSRFNGFMAAQTETFVPQLLEAYDFSDCRRIVDVGGGNGALVAGVLAAHPQAQGAVFDLEAGLDGAGEYLRRRGLRARCDLIAGSFFDFVPEGADTYLLRLVLHDWSDDRAAAILATCRRAMRPGAALLAIDHLLPERARDRPADRTALTLDLHMYVLFGARERTEAELSRMLEGAGFGVERVVATRPTATIVARAR